MRERSTIPGTVSAYSAILFRSEGCASNEIESNPLYLSKDPDHFERDHFFVGLGGGYNSLVCTERPMPLSMPQVS